MTGLHVKWQKHGLVVVRRKRDVIEYYYTDREDGGHDYWYFIRTQKGLPVRLTRRQYDAIFEREYNRSIFVR